MSQLRKHLVSGDWIIMASERAKRPHDLVGKKKPSRVPSPKKDCPFEDLKKTGNWPPVAVYPNEKNWQIVIVPNKYPALREHNTCAPILTKGPYSIMEGLGKHELLITRNHAKNISELPLGFALRVFRVLQERYEHAKKDPCLFYSSTFFNWGPTAGASLYHPHFQMLALPIVPPHVQHSLLGSHAFYKKHGKCPHCEVIRYEMKEKKRIIASNASAVAIAPFTSNEPFEIRIFPKKHFPAFEKTPQRDLKDIVVMLQQVLKKVKLRLNDPDFNFYVHTAPLKNQKRHAHYHWHIEILPKISIPAGFELSTGVEINVVDPDDAAALLRK